jgi:hypothetical protein
VVVRFVVRCPVSGARVGASEGDQSGNVCIRGLVLQGSK